MRHNGLVICNVTTLLKYNPRHMPRLWKRRVSSWRWWQPSTEQWFVFLSGQIVFGGILTALVNHLQFPSLKWNNIPFSLLSICLPLSLRPLSLPHPCSSFYCLSILSVLLYLGFFPVSSVSAPSSPSLLWPHTHWQTERQWQRLCHRAQWHTVAPAPTPMRW